MGRRQSDSELGRRALLFLLLTAALSCCMVYLCFSHAFDHLDDFPSFESEADLAFGGRQVEEEEEDKDCCRGIPHLELWGDAVKWGANFKLNSSRECCLACKAMCKSPCLCDSWVFCGEKPACGSNFGECWLKKQKDPLEPDRRDAGSLVMWTSGLVYGEREGIVGLETDYGMLRVHLLPDCAPHSVSYILELLALRHCSGCHFYRAESRGRSWDDAGNHIKHASYGPPYALIQGTLEAQGTIFKDISPEACPTVTRGSVAWVGSGPEFFISLAHHSEWPKDYYTVFGYVLPEDMGIVEKIARLPTKPEVWNNVHVAVLETSVPLRIRRIEKSPL
ncbi:unnamed protein product [Linum tenue]|uniref:PPIase cyclophilin-type domain-containing protein n=1 Tax=Linum tenue TaxID=586396 RepID=A0AAV0MIM1_9ROSI|nr:unnamed protein product [Linum tenue]